MNYAIVEDGGKQYKAVEGSTIEVDYFPAEIGEKVDLERVLLIVDGEDINIGTPLIEGAKVLASVEGQIKGPKIVVFKYKPSVRYRVKSGHRQKYTRLEIEAIEVDGKKKPKAAESKAPAEKPTAKAKASAEDAAQVETKAATAKKAPAKPRTSTKKTSTQPQASKKEAATKQPAKKKTTTKAKSAAKPKTSAKSQASTKKTTTNQEETAESGTTEEKET